MTNIGEIDEISRAIGGVFPLSELGRETGDAPNILQKWSIGARGIYCFHNARSALHHVLADLHPQRIWVPAYLCPEVLQSTRNNDIDVSYFPLSKELHPDIEFLKSRIGQHDAIMTISYFGRGPSKEWHEFVASKPDVVWIEDCAQVVDTGLESSSAVRIYSPRKIMGVPDGGVLVDNMGLLSPPVLEPLTSTEFAIPYRMRSEDHGDKRNKEWFNAYRKVEKSQCVSSREMSKLSKMRIDTISFASISASRRENYGQLFSDLHDLALFKEPAKTWIPFCFPILFDQADQLCIYLAQNRVFPPRYWLDLPSKPNDFPFEHSLSKQLIGLPCDQRYSREDMLRIVRLIRDFQQ